MQNSLRKYIRS